jgi:hypothetical protein
MIARSTARAQGAVGWLAKIGIFDIERLEPTLLTMLGMIFYTV